MLFIFVPLLSLILLAVNLLFAVHKPDEVKNSAYECGFSIIHGQTRSIFTIHFYIVAMLFLIFDLEVMLIYPICLVLYEVSYFGFVIALLFFIILTVGFILEIGSGAISLSKFEVKSRI
jgi:NADH-ubiquinone oxidoreductase chain 3